MEEANRTVREESVYAQTSDATNDIGLSDTEESQYGENQEWQMDNILAQTKIWEEDDNGVGEYQDSYLVKWTGYSIYKATWEPKEHFVNAAEVLHLWQDRKMRQLRGGESEFDVERFEDKQDQIQDKRRRRHQRRNRKRRMMGLTEKLYDDGDQEADDEDDGDVFHADETATPVSESDDDRPLSMGRRKRSATMTTSDSDQTMDNLPKRRRLDSADSKPSRVSKKGIAKKASFAARDSTSTVAPLTSITPKKPAPITKPRQTVTKRVVKKQTKPADKAWFKDTMGTTTAVGGSATTRGGRPPIMSGANSSVPMKNPGPPRTVVS